jgi:protein-disulfide isomerase
MRNKPYYLGLLALAFVLVGFDVVLFGGADEPAAERSLPVAAAPAVATPEPISLPSEPLACSYSAEAPVVENYASLIRPTDASMGPEDASVTFLEFFEPNCPHCINFHSTVQRVKAQYSDRVRFVFKPVVFWPRSAMQAQAMYAAHAEGKFFEMVDAQFALNNPEGLTSDQIKAIADEIGMDGDALVTRINGGVYRSAMMTNRADFQQTGWGYVPAVYINGKLVDNASRTPECIAQLLENELAS